MNETNPEVPAKIDWPLVYARLQASQEALDAALTGGSSLNSGVFRERAQRMAARSRPHAAEDTIPVMSFYLGLERYCLPLADLAEIMPHAHCTEVPGCPSELSGVISIRGEIRCVVDLGLILGLTPDGEGEGGGYILLLRDPTMRIGLKVHRVHQVDTFARKALVSVENAETDRIGAYARGIGNDALILLNLEQVLRHPVFQNAG